MKQKFSAAVLALSLTVLSAAFAQNVADTKGGATKPLAKRLPDAAIFLGSTTFDGGVIPDAVFDSLARMPITAKAKDGSVAQVLGYTLTFAERSIAEDSVGNPILAVDYFSEICTGDTLSTVLRLNLFDRTKPGDTVWYDRIQVATAAGQTGGKTMKFVIGR